MMVFLSVKKIFAKTCTQSTKLHKHSTNSSKPITPQATHSFTQRHSPSSSVVVSPLPVFFVIREFITKIIFNIKVIVKSGGGYYIVHLGSLTIW